MNALTYFLSGYFHQDWDHTHDTWDAVVDAFLNDNPARVSQVPLDINRLLVETPDDTTLKQALIESGMDYRPCEGYRAWLAAVRDRILNRPRP